jgi:hypothetical protein
MHALCEMAGPDAASNGASDRHREHVRPMSASFGQLGGKACRRENRRAVVRCSLTWVMMATPRRYLDGLGSQVRSITYRFFE